MHKKSLVIGVVIGLTAGAYSLSGASTFPDVNPSDWFASYVNKIQGWGIISGNDDGTFAPGRNVNRAELSKMFVQLDERTDAKISDALASNLSPSVASSLPTVMHLGQRNNAPSLCPPDWEEIDYGYRGSDQDRINERVCLTAKSCEVMQLTKHQNNLLADCPLGWNEANYGRVQAEDWQRTCYVCTK